MQHEILNLVVHCNVDPGTLTRLDSGTGHIPYTPLGYAIVNNKVEVARLLLQTHAHLQATYRPPGGMTAMELADGQLNQGLAYRSAVALLQQYAE